MLTLCLFVKAGCHFANLTIKALFFLPLANFSFELFIPSEIEPRSFLARSLPRQRLL